MTSTCLKVDHCNFTNTYFAIYMTSGGYKDTILTEVTNSKFSGDQYGNGSCLSGNLFESKLYVENCVFSKASDNYTYGNVVYKNNLFYKMRRITSSYLFGKNEFTCNRFIQLLETINIDMSGLYSKGSVYFTNNTLDSIGNTQTTMYSNLTLTRPASNYAPFGTVVIKDNNFLYNKGKGLKVAISAYNQTPTSSDVLDLKSNYWGSIDSTTIASYIKDYNDDINIYGKVDFSNFDSIPHIGCSYNPSCNKADFSFTVNDTTVTFTDKSYGGNPYSVKWKFGDGTQNDSNKKTVTHHYLAAGTYLVCLFVYDSLENLCDSTCKVVVIESHESCEASYYFAVDTNDNTKIYIVNTSKGTNSKTKWYWTFGDGSGSAAKNPTHTYSQSGKYGICLTIFDTSINCYSTFCDTVTLGSSQLSLMVINESDLTGINDPNYFSSTAVYPNPGDGVFHLNWTAFQEGFVKVDVYNSCGQILQTENFNSGAGTNTGTVDLSSYENGIYFVRINSGQYSTYMKVILRK